MMGLTERQRDALRYIEQYIAEHDGVAPSYDEIKAALGMGSKSGIHRLVRALVERGYMRRTYGLARAMELVTPDDRLLATVSTEALHHELSRRMAA